MADRNHSNKSHTLSVLIATLTSALLMTLATGCHSDIVFDEFVTVPQESWNQDSLAIFRAEVTDSVGIYDVRLQVRNDNSYAYQNLWLFVDMITPGGYIYRDTVDCVLAKDDGTWRGSGWGSLYTLQCPYLRQIRFPQTGHYTFRITQGMRAEDIVGIRNIGLIIQRHQTAESQSNGKE